MKQVFTGLFTEGVTDARFLENIVQKTLEFVAFECKGEIDIYLHKISIEKRGLSFTEQILKASKQGLENYGISILCIHADADSKQIEEVYENKIAPAIQELSMKDDAEYCKIVVAIIPIQEIEAWMLADKELLKKEIGTNKSDNKLGWNRNPEEITNPKEVIENAIRIARENLTKKRRRDLTISELYLPMGQALDLSRLHLLPSFQNFTDNIRHAFQQLHLLAILHCVISFSLLI